MVLEIKEIAGIQTRTEMRPCIEKHPRLGLREPSSFGRDQDELPDAGIITMLREFSQADPNQRRVL